MSKRHGLYPMPACLVALQRALKGVRDVLREQRQSLGSTWAETIHATARDLADMYLEGKDCRSYVFDIVHGGDESAGILGFSEEIRLVVQSGNPGGEAEGEDSFAPFMAGALADWFDGAKVNVREKVAYDHG